MRKQYLFSTITRALSLVFAVFLLIGGPLPALLTKLVPKLPEETWTRLFPALSPFAVFTANLAETTWYQGLFWGLPAVFFTILALIRGRFFCRWLCPAGTVFSLPQAVSRKQKIVNRSFSGIVFWSTAFAAIAGFPLLLVLDPLAIFSRTVFTVPSATSHVLSIIPGLILPVFLVLAFLQPSVWCTHFCPLGYFFELCHIKGKRTKFRSRRTRREILAGAVIGIPGGLVLRQALPFINQRLGANPPILPPGAGSVSRFTAMCSRCYRCVATCPTQVIRIREPRWNRTLNEFFCPELDTDTQYCDEWCNECIEACPTGALMHMTQEEKHKTKIGTARVIQDACLAWYDKEHCMVCQEYCPYLAIEADTSPEGIPRPNVLPDLCRGCGICQTNCPAERQGKAIIVHGIEKQVEAEDAF